MRTSITSRWCLGLIVVSLLTGGAFSTSAEAPSPAERPPQCATVTDTYAQLEEKIEASRARLISLRPASGGKDDAPLASPQAREEEVKLAELVFQQACVRENFQPDPVLVRGPAAPAPSWVTTTTYYATNRARGASTPIGVSYGAGRAPALEWGRVVISIPTRRKPGEMNLPLALWRFEAPADPARHFILKSVTPLSATTTQSEMRAKLAGLSRKSVLLFVHGFNVTFEDAALRTAQLSHDLDFPGLALLYSWPSLGQPQGYARDEEMAQLSISSVRAVLAQLFALGATDVTIVAHSMGNRVVAEGLREEVQAGRSFPNLKALLLAAPDINADVFRERLAPELGRLNGASRTIYAARSDAALKTSKVIHAAKRVGDADGGVLVFDGFDTIDASGAAPVLRGYGHSYVVDSAAVIGDMQDLILQRMAPARRGLAARGVPPAKHWVLP